MEGKEKEKEASRNSGESSDSSDGSMGVAANEGVEEETPATTSWWGGLGNLNELASSLRETVAPALEVVKRDLREFATTVTSDSATAIRTAVKALDAQDDVENDEQEDDSAEKSPRWNGAASTEFAGERLSREIRQLRLSGATYTEDFTPDEIEARMRG